MLMDLQELSLGVIHMEEGECVRRAPAPPTVSFFFGPGEESDAHRSLDSLLEPRVKDSKARSTIMDWDEAGDRSLIEWQKEEKPVRKRKRETCKRGKNIPPERKGSTKKKTGSKYLLVGVPKTRVFSDHPMDGCAGLENQEGSPDIREEIQVNQNQPSKNNFFYFKKCLQHFTTFDILIV